MTEGTRITPATAYLAPVAQMAEAGGLNPLQHGFESHRGHCVRLLATARADRALESGAVVVARRGKNASAPSFSVRRRAIRGPIARYRSRGSRSWIRRRRRRSQREERLCSLLLRAAARVDCSLRSRHAARLPSQAGKHGPFRRLTPSPAVLRRETQMQRLGRIAESPTRAHSCFKAGRNRPVPSVSVD